MEAEEPGDSSLAKIVEIAADDGVVLVVGRGEVKQRVYSFFLKTISKAFYAMFGPRFGEG
jgi:hypothetical protein